MLASHWFLQSWSFCHSFYSINLCEHIDCTNLELMRCVIWCFLASVVVQPPARSGTMQAKLATMHPSDGCFIHVMEANFILTWELKWSDASLTTITCNYLYLSRHGFIAPVFHYIARPFAPCLQYYIVIGFLAGGVYVKGPKTGNILHGYRQWGLFAPSFLANYVHIWMNEWIFLSLVPRTAGHLWPIRLEHSTQQTLKIITTKVTLSLQKQSCYFS